MVRHLSDGRPGKLIKLTSPVNPREMQNQLQGERKRENGSAGVVETCFMNWCFWSIEGGNPKVTFIPALLGTQGLCSTPL